MKPFGRLKAKKYVFRDPSGDRDLIVLYAGGKRVGFLEYDTARKFVDSIHDLADDHEREQREGTLT